jgi:hypothetical protein
MDADPADLVLDGQMAGYLAYYEHEGLAPGSQGLWDDACAHARPWGFELPDITVPVTMVSGGLVRLD